MIRWLRCVLVVLAACSHAEDGADRVHRWRDDLRVLANELPRRHKQLFFHTTEATWRKAVADLDARIPQLDDAHVVAGLSRLVAAIGDGHTLLGPFGRGRRYPLVLAWFDDGIHVIGADGERAWALGRRLAGIGTHPVDEVIAAMSPLISHDNDAGLRAALPELLVDPTLLAGADLATTDRATFRLAAADGSIRDLELRPDEHPVAIVPPQPLPLHLQGPATSYWNKYVEADRVLYFAYNACVQDARVGPFADFVAKTLAFADQHAVDRFVIDLRRNGGGNSDLIEPLIDGLAARPALAGRVFVIIGMHTYSSAILNAIELKRRLHATLVGGPTGGKPTHYGEVQRFSLPGSKLQVQYSTKFFDNPDFPGDALEPDLPVKVTSRDWFGGRDPAMDAILAAR